MPRPALSSTGLNINNRSPTTPLLAWYDRHARVLPWRVGPAERAAGVVPDPYSVWLSEIMLQQTTVAAVADYFRAFTKRWPDVESLAAAPLDDVLAAWAGLGYYARARNLKACADAIVAGHGGRFPETAAALQTLPGIGAYTSAAIAAIAFGEPVAAVDGNVERVISRLFAIDDPLPKAKSAIKDRAQSLVPDARAGDFAQALMDLGATICTPKRPACGVCPLMDLCLARQQGIAEALPVKPPKAEKPLRRGTAYVAVRDDGAVLLRRRPETGLLGGMAEVPGSNWRTGEDVQAPMPELFDLLAWRKCRDRVVHVFTHFRLELMVYRADAHGSLAAPADHWWSPPHQWSDEALPTLMRKVIVSATEAD